MYFFPAILRGGIYYELCVCLLGSSFMKCWQKRVGDSLATHCPTKVKFIKVFFSSILRVGGAWKVAVGLLHIHNIARLLRSGNLGIYVSTIYCSQILLSSPPQSCIGGVEHPGILHFLTIFLLHSNSFVFFIKVSHLHFLIQMPLWWLFVFKVVCN